MEIGRKIGSFLLMFLWANTVFATDLAIIVNRNLVKADSLKLLYEYQNALVLLDSTFQLSAINKVDDTLTGAIYYQQAELFFYKHEKEKALAKANLALVIQQVNFPKKHVKTAKTAYLIGLIHQRFKAPKKAKKALLEAINYTPFTDSNLYYLHRRLGYLYADSGRDSLAVIHFQKALVGFAYNSLEYIRISYWLATSLGETQQIQSAKNYFASTKTTCKTERKRFPTERRYLVELHNTLVREATFYKELGQPQQALKIYEQLVKIKDELTLTQKDMLWTYSVQKMELYFDYTKVYRAAGNTILDYNFPISTEEITNCACPEGLASTYEKMAHLYDVLGDYDKSFRYLQKAIKNTIPDFQPTNHDDLPDIQGQLITNRQLLVRLLFSFAKIRQNKYEKDSIISDLKIAVKSHQLIDTLTTLTRKRLERAKERYKIIEDTKEIFEHAIQLSIKLFEVSKDPKYLEMAYQFSAKNKAIILLDGLQNEQAKITAGITDKAILKEETRLKQAYNKLEIKILETEDADRKKQLYEKRFDIKNQYDRLVHQLEKEYPAYYELKYAFTKPLSVKDIQERLPDSTLLLEYFLGEEQLFVFSMNQLNFQYKIIPLPTGFRDTCTQYLALLDSGIDMPKKRYAQLAYELHQLILAQPLAAIKQSVNRLIIIPDDVLIPLSFATFLTKPIATWQGRKNPYLLNEYAVSYAYANQLLFDKSASQRVGLALKEFGGFGIEYHQETTFIQQKDTTINPVLNRSIGGLPNSDEEVLGIYQLINGFSWIPLKTIKSIPFLRSSIWINEEATKENFVKYAKDYKILHLAMHGLLANENPLNSALLFSPSTDEADNSLKAAELYSMKLNSEMVVLGACDTGRGKINKGEGIRSLARVFTYIGCPSLVASLWKASDEATKQIMLPFYENLAKKQPKDIALQKAQLQYLNVAHPEFATPSFWGHLALIGDAKPIEIAKAKYYWVYGIVFLIVVFLGFSVFFKR